MLIKLLKVFNMNNRINKPIMSLLCALGLSFSAHSSVVVEQYSGKNKVSAGEYLGFFGQTNNIKNGLFKTYNEDGSLKCLQTFNKNEAEGAKICYYAKFRKKSVENYFHGKLDGWSSFYRENKNLQRRLLFKDGNVRTDEEYYENGVLYTSESYNERGSLDGPYLEYYPNGALRISSFYSDGQVDGQILRYYNTGQLFTKENVVKGATEGEKISYHKNGIIASVEYYENGLLDGVKVTYKPEDGSEDCVTDYKKGKKIKQKCYT